MTQLSLWKALLLGFAAFFVDIITKFLTHHYIPLMNYRFPWYPYGGIPVFKNFAGIEFSISHATNRGAAWGILSDFQDYLIVLRMTLVLAMIIYLFFINKNKAWNIPLSLIIAGASGNILDSFLYGHVVDMFHFVLWGYDFPVFNVADLSIFMGISLLIIQSWSTQTKIKTRSS